MWTGTIGFGVMSIPVKVYKAADSNDLSFNNLHAACGGKTGVQTVCRNHGPDAIPIAKEDIIKGFEVSKGQFVQITDDELKALPLPSKDSIQIKEFVPAEEVDPVYMEQSYFIEADKGGAKVLTLLQRALGSRDLAAIGVVTFRKREQLCAIRVDAHGKVLLHTLYTEDEVRLQHADAPDASISDQELQMAGMLIDMQLKPEFTAEHHDQYETAVRALVEAKLAGKPLPTPAKPIVSSGESLEDLLRASLAKASAA
jgi:DNA end-binding protein Ku